MAQRLLLLLFFFTALTLRTSAANFVVTSNADSGPGTLREALTLAAANGNTEKDFINFNLPDLSEAGRTITLTSQLPYASSNITIDGATQPGNNFGRSNAKVCLQPATASNPFNAFILIDIDGFEIYGMYIRDFRGNVSNSPSQGVPSSASVLYIETSKNVTIGAPNKGNVFTNNGYIESTSYVSLKDGKLPLYGVENITACSNIFGLEPDGKTLRGTAIGYRGGFDLSYCKGKIIIGGVNDAQRNYFANGAMFITGYFTGPDRLFPSTFEIENNSFGYDIDGKPAHLPDLNASSIYAIFFAISRFIYSYDKTSYPYSFNIRNNKFQHPYMINVGRVSGGIVFQGNQLLNDPNPDYLQPSYISGIGFFSDNDIVIGGEQTGEANILYGAEIDALSRKSVLIQRNSIYCVNETRGIWYPAVPYLENPLPLPVIEIKKVSTTSVSGTATPLSKVELFWDDDCRYCQPLTYITTVNADANGNWQYNGIIQKGVVASATLNGFTSLFTKSPDLKTTEIQPTSCGRSDGSIKVVTVDAGSYLWKDQIGTVIGNTNEIKNLSAGKYTLIMQNGSCSKDYTFEILDATPRINDTYINLKQPSCNTKGAIINLYLDNTGLIGSDYTYKWLDAAGNIKSTNINLTDADEGTYHLEVTYKTKCTTVYGPVTLQKTGAPLINQTNAVITPSPCGLFTGSIKGVTATGSGTLSYSWKNQFGTEVSTTPDLLNKPGGKYRLQVTTDGGCTTTGAELEIPEINGVSLNTTNGQALSASCEKANGSIIGLQASGATQITWARKADNVVIGNLIDLKNIPAGDYVLTLKNTTCSKSYDFTVNALASSSFGDITVKATNTCDAFVTGKIAVNTDNAVEVPAAYRWVNSASENAAFGKVAQFLAAGTYKLYLTNKYGCENFYAEYTVGKYPPFVNTAFGIITNIKCGIGRGSITGIAFTGGTGNYIYQWYQLFGTDRVILSGKTSPFLDDLSPGSYLLVTTDGGCSLSENIYTIIDEVVPQAPPVAPNVNLLSAGQATINVTDPYTTAIYRLYDAQTASTPIDEQRGGTFMVNVTQSKSFYLTLTFGYCESNRVEVKVTVDPTVNEIANTFTPNGDGVNDYWKIKGLDGQSRATVSIFTRNGKMIYQSLGYAAPFDGTYQGKALPAGVYYYTIKLTASKVISGHVTILR